MDGSDQRLHDLIEDLRTRPAETPWIEFKANYADPEKIGRLISAISNAATIADREGGYVLWGIADDSHDIVGTQFAPSSTKAKGNQPLEIWLASMLKPSIAFHFCEAQRADGHRVVLLEVPSAASVPTKFQEIAYIRVGSATPKLSDYPGREAELLVKLRPFLWEKGIAASYVAAEQVLERLDHAVYFRLTETQTPSTQEGVLDRLAADGLIEPDVGGRWNIRNLGAILFAHRLANFEDMARRGARVIQYAGTGKEVTKRQDQGGHGYARSFQNLINFINNVLPSEERIDNGLRSIVRTFPEVAIRELVANALIHQDFTVQGAGPMFEIYSDRVEFTNPGTPITEVAEKLFGAPPRSRNPALAALMRRMRMCEELGSGIVKVIASAEAAQLPGVPIHVADGITRVTLFGPRSFAAMSPLQRMGSCYQHTCLRFHKGQMMTNPTLRQRFGMGKGGAAQMSRLIRDTVKAGVIQPQDPKHPRQGYIPFWG